MLNEENNIIVIDDGKYQIRAGFPGNLTPNFTIESESTIPQKFSNLIPKGIFQDWDYIEQTWTEIFKNKMQIDPQTHKILVSESPLEPIQNRFVKAEILFEKFQFQKAFFAIQNVLALYGSGKTTGVSVNLGFDTISIVPIFDEKIFPNSIKRLEIGGWDIDQYLFQLLMENSQNKNLAQQKSLSAFIRKAKEKFAFLESNNFDSSNFLLGNITKKQALFQEHPEIRIDWNDENSKCAEILFNPQLYGINNFGIQKLLHISIDKKSPLLSRKKLFENILLFGGSSQIHGLKERLSQELPLLTSKSLTFNIDAQKSNENLVWIGGSFVASKVLRSTDWIDKSEYSEYGESICYKKCF
ncbi:actin-17-related [Anaeramoeba ignava]|uniref:Actin-17-related n=1 Tax=Anaeramoeba ignava TaxID=1746090 RepID=A0A9Q0LEA4_ANAIG|nr:actin-17-related [Anaeramoeba ignava]